ncbi:MAG TPA: hypothetical protein GX702_03185, partial [Chloroflexi bacterium]|nr:hypothetical protein [Chloroflexota bacterium]
AGLLLFTHYLSSRRWPHLVLASISFALALFSNEVSVIALPLTLMTEWVWARQRGSAIKAGPGGYDKYAIWLGFVALVAFMSLAGPRAFRLQPGTLDPRQRFETYQIQGISLALAKEMVSYITYMIWPQILLWDLGVDAGSLALAVATLAGTLLLLARGTRHERLFISWALLALVPIVLFVPFGVADRYFYVAAMGLTAALGSAGVRLWDLLQTPRSLARWLPGAMLAMYLVTSVVALQVRALEWHRAGQMARDIVSQIIALQPEVPSNSHMFFVGLPARYGQAYIYMGGGIGSAIRMAYGDYRIQVYRSVDPDLKQWLDRAPDGISREGVYLFVYRDGVMEDHSGRVNDVKTFLNDWWWYH